MAQQVRKAVPMFGWRPPETHEREVPHHVDVVLERLNRVGRSRYKVFGASEVTAPVTRVRTRKGFTFRSPPSMPFGTRVMESRAALKITVRPSEKGATVSLTFRPRLTPVMLRLMWLGLYELIADRGADDASWRQSKRSLEQAVAPAIRSW